MEPNQLKATKKSLSFSSCLEVIRQRKAGPGSGKGTLCARLVEHQKFVHLSAGDLLREEKSRGTENAALINDYIANGKIVPVAITISLLKGAMEANGWAKRHFLIDGFPRNQDNVDGWNQVVGESANVVGIIYIKCSEETMTNRIMKRSETSGRIDDTREVIAKRFVQYATETFPIIEANSKLGMKVFEVNGEKSPDEVYSDCIGLIGGFINHK